MWTIDFWKAVLERAIKTLAQAAGAALVGAGTGLIETNWIGVLSVAGMAAIISVLTSIGSGAVTGGETSLTQVETITAKRAITDVGRSTAVKE